MSADNCIFFCASLRLDSCVCVENVFQKCHPRECITAIIRWAMLSLMNGSHGEKKHFKVSKCEMRICTLHWKYYTIIGPIRDDSLKEKILKPWKGALISHSVCLSVCVSVCVCVCERAIGHTFWPRNLIFGLSDP